MKSNIVAALVLFVALTLGAALPSYANTEGSQSFGIYRIAANSNRTFTATFAGGEIATVAVVGDGDTDLDLYVYNENGNLVGKDDGPKDDCIVTWTPRWTGRFTIKVVNRGNVYNDCLMLTN